MNIQALTPNFLQLQKRCNNDANSTVSCPKLNILDRDTVSFSGSKKGEKNENKNLDSMAGAVSVSTAKRAHNEVDHAGKRIYSTLKKYLKPLVATSSSPNNPICAGEKGIKYRVKDDISICEKTATREIKNKEDIFKMGDVLGFRIVLRENSPKNVEKVLKQLGEAVKCGDLNIIEIENYLLPDGRGYCSTKALEKLASVCNPNELDINLNKKIKSGYPAIHIGIKTKEGYIGEIQIMGKDVEDVKDLDDWFYKILDNKPLKKKYRSAQIKIENAIKSLTPDQMNVFMQYRRDSFTRAFEEEPREYNTRKKSQFIDIPYFLPRELGYQWVADQKIYLDSQAAKQK